ncbi:MAG: hypothetical protein ABSC30_14845 [Acidimicrobiales bacterium]|jgi:hypothetical protein
MDAEEAARAHTKAVAYLPAGFMLDGATYERGGELGFEGIDFYMVGRGGALGDVDGLVVAAAFVFFNPETVVGAWERTRPLMARHDATEAFAGCLDAWARTHLPDDVDYGRLAELLGRVNDHASVSAAPLFAAWKAVPEPEDRKALALQRLNVLRELRNALHGAAVLAAGLEPLEALLIKTPFMAGAFGWEEPFPEVASRRPRWEEAEAATNRMVARAYSVLDAGELSELVDLTTTAQKAAT